MKKVNGIMINLSDKTVGKCGIDGKYMSLMKFSNDDGLLSLINHILKLNIKIDDNIKNNVEYRIK